MVSADVIQALSVEVAALKDEGNDYFRAGDFLKAAGSYTKAIKVSTRFTPRFGTFDDIFYLPKSRDLKKIKHPSLEQSSSSRATDCG